MAVKKVKIRTSKRGSTKVIKRKVSRNDLRKSALDKKHQLNMAKVNNESYQKELTKRLSGAYAATSIATPATTALANTNAFSSGGFNVNSNVQPSKGVNQDEEDESGSSSNSKPIWG